MLATIKLFDTEKLTKKGYPIKVELFYSNKKRPRKTIGHSLTEYWNAEKSEPRKEHPNYYDLLPVLLDYHAKITKINYGSYTFEEAKGILFGESIAKVKKLDATFFVFLDAFVKKKEIKGESIQRFTNLKSTLKKYTNNEDFKINDITYEWLDDFCINKLQTTRLKQGGLMTYLRAMRTVYKEAQRHSSLHIKPGNPFLGIIKTPVTVKEVVELTPGQVNLLLNFEPKPPTSKAAQKRMKRNIAVWHFQFLIGGCDYVDIALLKWSDIKEGRIRFKRYKNRNMHNGGVIINNFMNETALHIIENFGTKNNDRIFGFIPDPKNTEAYQSFRGSVNYSLANICKQADVPKVTTKSTRYIFRTYAGEKLIHDLVVMKLQGHTPAGVTYRYQGSISPKVQDKAHRKIIKVIQKKA